MLTGLREGDLRALKRHPQQLSPAGITVLTSKTRKALTFRWSGALWNAVCGAHRPER
ncbi:MAG: hypothetical protein AB7Q81_11865 [Gammaproteobacteria bacterium]